MPWQNNNGGNGPRNPWGNGPQGGGGQQPPDIDEMIRKGQDKLKGVLPGGFKGKGGFSILLLVVVLLWAGSGFYRVETQEEGVVLRFGEWVRTETPGLKWHIPFPIEEVYVPNVTANNQLDIGFRSEPTSGRGGRQTSFPEESLMLTGDENIVDVDFTVFWKIDDASAFLFNIQSPQDVTIKAVAESAMREVIGKTQIQDALTGERNAIQVEAQQIIQTTLDSYGSGIQINEVKLQRVDPPSQVIDAFRDVQAAEADKERFQNEADAYANSIIPAARGESARMLQEAQAYKQQVIAASTGDASRFLAVYKEYAQAKDITKKRMYLETMEQILSGMNKIIIDGDAGNGVVPYLPLSELTARGNNNGSNDDE